MNWIFFSVLAALLWAAVNVIDKHILSKLISRPELPALTLGVFGGLASSLIFVFHGFEPIPWPLKLLGLLAGSGYFLGNYFYYHAIKIEDVSKVVPLFHLAPMFIALLAALTLGEIFTPSRYLGVALLVAGAILLSLKNIRSLSFGRGLWLMLAADLFVAMTEVITKSLLNRQIDFLTVFAYVRLGAFIAVLPLIVKHYGAVRELWQSRPRVVAALGANQLLNLTAIFCLTLSSALGFVTLANALSSLQSFFVLSLVLILSAFFPSFLKEEFSGSALARRVIALIILFSGAILVS